MASAFSRRSASPVRITAPVSTSAGGDAGLPVGLGDDRAQSIVVDPGLARIRRERHRRQIQGLARDDIIAAGQILGETAQVQARKDHLRAGRADIDADTGQMHIVLDPEWIFLERTIDLEIVVIVIGLAIVHVIVGLPHGMFGEAVRRRSLVVFSHGVPRSVHALYFSSAGCGAAILLKVFLARYHPPVNRLARWQLVLTGWPCWSI